MTRRAGRLGLAWGAGHALALAIFGLPVVLLGAYLSDPVQHATEAAVGLMIVFLAARLLLRWRRAHPAPGRHRQWQAFGIGLVHGMGGSAGVCLLLLATISDEAHAVAALMVLALGTAISMAMLSSGFGYAITRGPVLTRMLASAPAMGLLTLAFGCWYTLGALGAVP